MFVGLEDFQKTHRGCPVDSRDPKCTRALGVSSPRTRSRCLGLALPWRGSAYPHPALEPAAPHSCGCPHSTSQKHWAPAAQMWCCCALDPQSREGHQKSICLRNGPFQQPAVPPAQSHMCIQPLRPFWKIFVWSGAGWAQRCS